MAYIGTLHPYPIRKGTGVQFVRIHNHPQAIFNLHDTNVNYSDYILHFYTIHICNIYKQKRDRQKTIPS
ncbi:hypothetical protein D3C80_1742100 [compost metagenome]